MTKTRRLTVLALLCAVALVMITIEFQLPSLTSVPGIKLGLSNIVTLFTMYTLGPGSALTVLGIRVILGGILTGQVGALAYSLSGGLLAYLVLFLLCRRIPVKQLWVLSVLSAISHNVGQILAAVAISQTPELWWYLPVLVISGVVTGAFTGLAAQFLLFRLEKTHGYLFSKK